MLKNQAISFFEEISKNKKLAEELNEVVKGKSSNEEKARELISLAKKYNFNFTAQDLANAQEELIATISPEDLSEVSGGMFSKLGSLGASFVSFFGGGGNGAPPPQPAPQIINVQQQAGNQPDDGSVFDRQAALRAIYALIQRANDFFLPTNNPAYVDADTVRAALAGSDVAAQQTALGRVNVVAKALEQALNELSAARKTAGPKLIELGKAIKAARAVHLSEDNEALTAAVALSAPLVRGDAAAVRAAITEVDAVVKTLNEATADVEILDIDIALAREAYLPENAPELQDALELRAVLCGGDAQSVLAARDKVRPVGRVLLDARDKHITSMQIQNSQYVREAVDRLLGAILYVYEKLNVSAADPMFNRANDLMAELQLDELPPDWKARNQRAFDEANALKNFANQVLTARRGKNDNVSRLYKTLADADGSLLPDEARPVMDTARKLLNTISTSLDVDEIRAAVDQIDAVDAKLQAFLNAARNDAK